METVISANWINTLRTLLEVAATVAFALSGVILAARKRLDAVGVCVVAFVAAFGGGTLRDLLPGPVNAMLASCVAIQNGHALGAKRSWGEAPARLGNTANGHFGLQPQGKAASAAPLVFAWLAKAPALALPRA